MARFVKLTLLAFLVFFSSACATPFSSEKHTHRRETNADRFARGLPPLKPVKLYDPSRTGPALARRSVTPLTGSLQITPVGSNTPICWMNGASQSCTAPSSGAAPFTASVGAGSPSAQELDINSGTYSGDSLIACTYDTANQGPDTNEFLFLTPYNGLYTDAGAAPSYDSASSLYYESTMHGLFPCHRSHPP
ncbi:hypothetical protein DACRYDRAFT_110175 [Dacryopinax primogenitus]|uniref:Ig-like domain-containing protein n=1 Tax=Dacryopinax primogenitus (strain DJM 731) TaxID=1858805 RepID=M5FV39_DACPD|nr:uncharacterized protein DACRYDRAFT_110175 [Dacryopinax primogenitus]EJT99454.1 hypothetical protein DACRYDRAFT_110175 [Dacryopinax primogenitus]